MAKFKFNLSIGCSTAMETDEMEIDDEELKGLSEEEREKYIQDRLEEWASNYIEMWFEEANS